MMETDLSFSGNSYVWNMVRNHGQRSERRVQVPSGKGI